MHIEKSPNCSLNSEFFLNARVDAFMTEDSPSGCLAEAIARGNAYAGLGADCIFFINVTEAEVIARLVKEITAPVSILWREGAPNVAQLHDIGVARVSYGSAFARMAVGAVRSLAKEILERGTCELLAGAITTPELRQLLRTHRDG